jgi:hypothetical protein
MATACVNIAVFPGCINSLLATPVIAQMQVGLRTAVLRVIIDIWMRAVHYSKRVCNWKEQRE